jgi:hypothetical protein
VNPRTSVTPIALIVLAAGTAAYAYFVDRHTVSDADRAQRRSDLFPSFRTEAVTRITLEHGNERLVLERVPDGGPDTAWRMLAPRRQRADDASVDVLLRELEMATKLREVDAGVDAGVEAPRARAVVQVGALEYRLALGADASPPKGAAYLQLDGEGTFVVEHSLAVQLLRGADTYRDRTIVPYRASAVARLSVQATPGDSFELDRHGASFRIVASGLRASRSAVDRLLESLADGRAESFASEAEADRTVAAPHYFVTVYPRDAHDPLVEVAIGAACIGHPDRIVVVRRRPERLAACVARGMLDGLPADASTLVDASPLFAHADEIEELRFEPVGAGATSVDIARRASGWHERAPEDRDLGGDEADAANTLATALAGARATGIPSSTARPFTPRSRLTAVRTGGETTEALEIGAPGADGTALVRRADDGAMLALSRTTARRFEPHPIALRAGSIWATPVDPTTVVAVDDSCGPAPQRLEMRDGAWSLRSPAGLPADPVAATELVSAFVHAKAAAWVDESDDGSSGIGTPGGCTVTLTSAGAAGGDAGAGRVSVIFGAPVDGDSFARTTGDPAVFIAPPALRSLASRPVIDRSGLSVPDVGVSSLVVIRGAARRVVATDAGDDPLAAAVRSLFAQRAVHAGPPTRDEAMDRPTLEIVATAQSDGGSTETRITVGAAAPIDGAPSYYARVSGIDATFAVPESRVEAIVNAL